MLRRAALVLLPLAFLGALAALIPREAWFPARPDAPAPDGPPLALGWEDLVPAGFVPPEDPFLDITPERLAKLYDGSPESRRELDGIEARMRHAPVVERLDGRLVTLAGYVVPLDFDGRTRLEEFLLVPYYGACIHTPPPPANQIVLASLERPVDVDDPYAPVRLRGILRTERVAGEIAESGYRMDVVALERDVSGP